MALRVPEHDGDSFRRTGSSFQQRRSHLFGDALCLGIVPLRQARTSPRWPDRAESGAENRPRASASSVSSVSNAPEGTCVLSAGPMRSISAAAAIVASESASYVTVTTTLPRAPYSRIRVSWDTLKSVNLCSTSACATG